ncbi:hypothetical protein [Streptomyces sp. NBC_00996]|uniref:hypothetical protein n=1 Tax=Streptomyces sp. NBC_00996 TaxID=2903710 RepID=UPI00386E1214|nr:hypothetical protein OG390_44350 [Streptomyces sp. NBC_00996]
MQAGDRGGGRRLGRRGAVRKVARAVPRTPLAARHRRARRRGRGRLAAGADVETLYLGCNGITAGGACRIADNLRASPRVVTGVWLKRNPLGSGGGRAAAELIEAARSLRTLDLVQTGLDASGTVVLADALLAAADKGRRIERLFIGGNRS